MARHRNVRKLDFDDEFGYDDVYGRSLEDEPTVSPSTAAQFLYTRESRAAPSLSSFIDPSSSGCGVSRSISEPYQSRSKPKPTTSPLASSSVSASAATQGEKIGGQPGFKLSAEDSLYSSKTAMKDYSKCNVSLQKGTIPDPVSMHTLSSTSSCIYGLAKNSILGPGKDDSNNCSCKLGPFDNKGGPEQGQRKQPNSQMTLLDLITEDKSFLSHPIEKPVMVTSLAKSGRSFMKGQKAVMSDQIEVEPNAVPLESFTVAQSIQHEIGTSNVPEGLHFSPFLQTQKSYRVKEISLSDLARLSCQAPSSLRSAHMKENNATLSDLHSKYKVVPRLSDLSYDMGIRVVSFHSTTFASIECDSSKSTFKSSLTVQCDRKCVGLPVKGFALMMCRPTEDGVPLSLSRLRRYIDNKLTRDYMGSVFKTFDFSDKSPDDIIQEKQHNVFQR